MFVTVELVVDTESFGAHDGVGDWTVEVVLTFSLVSDTLQVVTLEGRTLWTQINRRTHRSIIHTLSVSTFERLIPRALVIGTTPVHRVITQKTVSTFTRPTPQCSIQRTSPRSQALHEITLARLVRANKFTLTICFCVIIYLL